ncbi:TPA: hypothetical protein N2X54_004550 [Escherichia coli]|nr:hypothetical protein [Escherichia coli]HBA3263755.1 hypothetical protein [Escherichia coli]HCK1113679.1 hypothetical protein [Escherichia coli]HCK1642651.1 hypothetical protein [Escherichia coli]HCL7557438.1 hypothetical protein [Escherichia coli]
MSKLLALISQQQEIEAQIEKLKKDEKEAKVFEAVKEIKAVQQKYGYEDKDFVDVLLTFYNVNAAKPAKRAYTKSTAAKPKADTYPVKIGADTVALRKPDAGGGRLTTKLKTAMTKAGFEKYDLFLNDLMTKNKVKTFDELIEKIGVKAEQK